MSITYPDENEHTIKVEKIIGNIEPILVKNFATEIKNIPDNKYNGSACKVTLNYNVPTL
jgi:hypothetical protein